MISFGSCNSEKAETGTQVSRSPTGLLLCLQQLHQNAPSVVGAAQKRLDSCSQTVGSQELAQNRSVEKPDVSPVETQPTSQRKRAQCMNVSPQAGGHHHFV